MVRSGVRRSGAMVHLTLGPTLGKTLKPSDPTLGPRTGPSHPRPFAPSPLRPVVAYFTYQCPARLTPTPPRSYPTRGSLNQR